MKLLDLQDELRAHIRARIGRGELTVSGLARDAGFPQGHLSNFLNARRGLSLESMDRLLDTLGIGVLDLVDVRAIARRSLYARRDVGLQAVPLVAEENASLAQFAPHQILETRSFNKSFLRRLKARYAVDRRDWLRFVVIKVDGKRTREFFPSAIARATLLIDRHYSSLESYRRRPNLYAVGFDGRCVLGSVALFDDVCVLRPNDPQEQLRVIHTERGSGYSEHIIGRVCHVGVEV